jgi:hypothetical protein
MARMDENPYGAPQTEGSKPQTTQTMRRAPQNVGPLLFWIFAALVLTVCATVLLAEVQSNLHR